MSSFISLVYLKDICVKEGACPVASYIQNTDPKI